MKIKAVLFDMDGVLLDTEKYLTKYIREAAKEFGYDMSEEVSYTLRSFAAPYANQELKRIYGKDFEYLPIRKRKQEMMKEHLEKYGLETKPDVEEVVTELKRRGYKVAVVTATNETRAREYLEMAGFDELFEEIISGSMVDRGKPFPDVYDYACQELHAQPEECVAIEDSPNGVSSAYAAGCNVIMVPDLTQPDAWIEKRIYAKADRLLDLLDILK